MNAPSPVFPHLLNPEAVRKAVKRLDSSELSRLNLRALEKGVEYGNAALGGPHSRWNPI